MKHAFLVLSDKYEESIINHFENIRESTKNLGDSIFLFHQKEEKLPQSIKTINHFVFTNEILDQLGYQPIENTLVPGSNHFPLLKFYLQNPNYDYYWNIEDDVRFFGNWNYLFETFSEFNHDFISSHVKTRQQFPNWYWWGNLKYKGEPTLFEKRLKSFNPIYRISNRALRFLHQSLLEGWTGHHEVLIPSLLNNKGFSILDFGGEGDFTLPNFEHKFYTNETMKDANILMGNKLNTLYHPIKNMKINKKAKKKQCVISAVGEKSLHQNWINENPDFDLHLIVYDNSFDKFKQDTPYITQSKGYKFKLVYNYLISNPDFIEHYDYFYIPDDDIRIDTSNIHKLFEYMQEYNLDIAQPALTNSYYTYNHTIKHNNFLLRYTNFVEVMQPCFSVEALKKVLFTFKESQSGWGIDFHWKELVNSMAIIDDIVSIHTRPVKSNFHGELHQYLQKYNLNSEIKEFEMIPNEKFKKNTPMQWKPIITDIEKRIEVEARLKRIANFLIVNASDCDSIGLMNGKMGIMLFFFHYYQFTQNTLYEDFAAELMEDMQEELWKVKNNTNYADGLAGIGWGIEYLAQNNFIENYTDEILEETDRHMFNISVNNQDSFDILKGKNGKGMYFIARIKNPLNSDENINHLINKHSIMYYVDNIDKYIKVDEEGYLKGEKIKYGLRNGVAGIVSFLIDVYHLDVYNEIVERLLRNLLADITKHKDDILTDYAQDWSWENGIIGICLALYKAGYCLNCSQTLATANALAESIIFDEIVLNDKLYFHLYNGKIGFAHLFSRLYYYTQNNKYKHYSELYYNSALKLDNKEGIVGFEFINDSNTCLGILGGIAGIGLSLMASISEHEPFWDKGLLL